ncbi:hypothetical protein P3S67_020223 [Capsicum chacoense]
MLPSCYRSNSTMFSLLLWIICALIPFLDELILAQDVSLDQGGWGSEGCSVRWKPSEDPSQDYIEGKSQDGEESKRQNEGVGQDLKFLCSRFLLILWTDLV